ncbi:STAS domain-containing protein [Pseudomonas lijiangensis]|uniref:STAS domain-containing protein n=1 Tax=Pseudomonas syringae group TaxID=136849 RepID=UPI0018E655D3|nr:STAS domain-containing protein [Pseudomonas cichorii]MBI6855475.1 STAS domain-containing protein [Pseudomonas cichorii]
MFSITEGTQDTPTLMHVKGDLTIYEVRQAHELLMPLISPQAQAWQLDLSGVDEIDSAGVQLLLALQRELSLSGASATVSAASPSVMEMTGLLALDVLQPVAQAED